jgi:flagellar motor switch protein FliN/FliY
MSQREVTPRDALTRLGASSAEAIARVLEMLLPGGVERGEVTVLADGASPFSNLPYGAIATSVSYVDGVTGANVFVMPPSGAHALALAMGVPPDEDEEPGEPLSEFEQSAIGEAANQMMAAAAAAIGVVLGQEIEISPPQTRVLDDADAALDAYGSAPHATSVSFKLAGETCRLIQLVPSAFVVRMVRAIDELSGEAEVSRSEAGSGDGAPAAEGTSLTDALRDISLRVWAELGRSDMALGRAVELPFGSVVELDRRADAPVELYVNGLCFAYGELLVTEDGEWAFRLERLARDAGSRGVPALLASLPT